jgi:hypothetical protein
VCSGVLNVLSIAELCDVHPMTGEPIINFVFRHLFDISKRYSIYLSPQILRITTPSEIICCYILHAFWNLAVITSTTQIPQAVIVLIKGHSKDRLCQKCCELSHKFV